MPGCGSPSTRPRCASSAEVEAEHDLAEAVARRLVEPLDLLEAHALEQLGDEHAAARERGVDRRDVRERVPAERARHRALVLGLELVVELLGDALAQLAVERLRVEPRREALDEREEQRGLRRSVSTASATPGYWIFTATARPSAVTARWTWPIDAAAKASSSNSEKTSPSRSPSSCSSSLRTFGNGSGGTSSRSEASVP